MKDKVVLITGAGSGIGHATALAFAARGARLAITDIDGGAIGAVGEEAKALGAEVITFQADASSPDDADRIIAGVRQHYGRLDAAHNNVGVADYATGVRLADKPLDVWHRTIALTLSSTFYALRTEIPLMLESGGGAIVNTASVAGLVAVPDSAAYVAAKHGVIGLTKAVCLEYAGQGIRCNAVAPGNILTPPMRAVLTESSGALDAMMATIPAGRLGEPEEIAEAVVWLCSPAASYVNGICMAVDGGYIVC